MKNATETVIISFILMECHVNFTDKNGIREVSMTFY